VRTAALQLPSFGWQWATGLIPGGKSTRAWRSSLAEVMSYACALPLCLHVVTATAVPVPLLPSGVPCYYYLGIMDSHVLRWMKISHLKRSSCFIPPGWTFRYSTWGVSLCLCLLYWSQNEQRLWPSTALTDCDVLLTVHLSIFISVINQLDAQNFCFTISLFHASTCFEHMCCSSGGQNCITQPLVSSHLPTDVMIPEAV